MLVMVLVINDPTFTTNIPSHKTVIVQRYGHRTWMGAAIFDSQNDMASLVIDRDCRCFA